jgi:hypothetical protein
MQPILRAPCPDTPPSSAAFLAALIDKRARTGGVPTDPSREPGAVPDSADGRGGSVLIWVEAATDGPVPFAGHQRGMIVVAYGPGPEMGERSFVISYPVEAGSRAQRTPAVLGLLRTKGWSLMASRRRTTAAGHANTAVLVNTDRSGGEQWLWLAEPVPASRTHGRARRPGFLHPLRPTAAPAALTPRRQGRAWFGGSPSGDPGA